MDQDFYDAIQKDSKTAGLVIFRSGKPWEEMDPCKSMKDVFCDRITIHAEKRQLLISCTGNHLDKRPGPPCQASTDVLFREKCIDTLPGALVKELWNHSKAFHKGEDP
jgi:hypothetical protein